LCKALNFKTNEAAVIIF